MASINNIFDQMFEDKLPMTLKKSMLFESNAQHELEAVRPPKVQLREMFGKVEPCFSESIGPHPDFSHLKDNDTEHHYVSSVFIDISGSSRLGLKFELTKVRLYKNAILRSAIEIFQAFDGHIHRLQGDAVFAFFGHKGLSKADALINAINASALMQSYNKQTLTGFFNQNGLPPLKIRIGIDIGDDEKVLWSQYGIENVNEITTTSIHTDLAAKLQSKSKGNGIMLGENVYKYLDIPEHFLEVKKYQKDNEILEDKHILKNPDYSMKQFKWGDYLDHFAFLPKDDRNPIKSPEDFEIKCYIIQDENRIEYRSNSKALLKEIDLEFEIIAKTFKPSNIKWKVENYGEEATENDSVSFFMDNQEGQFVCKQKTAYNGQHDMICILYDGSGRQIAQDRFGVIINDNTRILKDLTL